MLFPNATVSILVTYLYQIKYISMTIILSMQKGCITLFTYYCFFVLPEQKRSVELCKRENNNYF